MKKTILIGIMTVFLCFTYQAKCIKINTILKDTEEKEKIDYIPSKSFFLPCIACTNIERIEQRSDYIGELYTYINKHSINKLKEIIELLAFTRKKRISQYSIQSVLKLFLNRCCTENNFVDFFSDTVLFKSLKKMSSYKRTALIFNSLAEISKTQFKKLSQQNNSADIFSCIKSESTVSIYKAKEKKEMLLEHEKSISAYAINKDASRCATISDDGKLSWWHIENSPVCSKIFDTKIDPVKKIFFSNMGKNILVKSKKKYWCIGTSYLFTPVTYATITILKKKPDDIVLPARNWLSEKYVLINKNLKKMSYPKKIIATQFDKTTRFELKTIEK